MNTQDYPDIDMNEKRLAELIKLVKAQSKMIEEFRDKLDRIEIIIEKIKRDTNYIWKWISVFGSDIGITAQFRLLSLLFQLYFLYIIFYDEYEYK